MESKIHYDRRNVIISIGLSGFPYALAPAQKLFLIAKAVRLTGDFFWVVCNTFIKKNGLNCSLKRIGRIDGVAYCTTSPSIFTPNSIIKKVSHKFAGKFAEIKLINKFRKQKRIKGLIVYSKSFTYCLFWAMYAKIYGLKISLIYFELLSSLNFKKTFAQKFSYLLFDKYIFNFFDGVITISDHLILHINNLYPEKKIIKVPPLVDFSLFLKTNKTKGHTDYFLYCGTLFYLEIIEFIIESFSRLPKNDKELFLVLNGDGNALEKVNQKIAEKKLSKKIKIFSNLTYEQLLDLYVNSLALLIPLRDTPQDRARFPQKIAEYCAAQRPIITTRIGEVVNYFDDSSMVFSNKYEVDEFSRKMEFVIENRERCERIAGEGYRIGKMHFDYLSFSGPLNVFFSSL